MKKIVFILFLTTFLTTSFGQLSGDYYIPQGVNPQGYATLALAIADLNANGCSGTIYFYIDGDLAETGASLIITRSDLNQTNNLIIKTAPTKTPTITITGCTSTAGANQYAGFTLSGAGYISIDGSNTGGGTTRDLTFNMNDGTNGRDGIVLYGNCDNVTIKNVKVKYTVIGHATTGRGIYLNGQASGAADNCIIDNCEIGENLTTLVGPHHGIGYTGSSGSAIYCMNGTVSNNTIYANIRGINLFWHNGVGSTMNIYGNTVSIMNPASGNVIWGILHQAYTGTTNFYDNRIQTMTQKSTSTQGIYSWGTLAGVASAGTITNVYNNFLGGAVNHTGSGVAASIDLISFQDNPANSVVRVHNNTVVLNSFVNISGTRNTCIRFNPVSTQTFEIRNNIFINNIDNAKAYVFHYGGGTALNFTSNYNNAYVSGSNANIGLATSDRKTLSNWSTAFTPNQDANSVSKAVSFVSATDLHLTGASLGDNDLYAPAIAGYATDIDGDTRQWGYKGADEQNGSPIPTTNWTVSMSSSLTNAKAFGNTSKIGSDGAGVDFYATWDANFIYLGWNGGRTNYSSDLYFAAIDTDPDGTNGTNNSVVNVGFQSGGPRPDYMVVYENNSSYFGAPASLGNAFELWRVESGNWSWVNRTDGNDNSSSKVIFTDGPGEVRLRIPWAQLGSFTPANGTKLGLVMWNNNPDGNYMWARVPTSNPENGSTPITLTMQFVYNNTGEGVNPGTDRSEVALPVELTSLSKTIKDRDVSLSWKTATEINSYMFEVERSEITTSQWLKVGEVSASGNSNSPKEYSFTDKNLAPGKYAYRLKMIDNDGTFEYSDIVEAEVIAPTEFALYQNYPNPFNPVTTINYSIPVDASVQLYIFTITGELVQTLVNEQQTAGSYSVNFDARQFASGTYIYRLVANDFVQTKKMVLLK